MTAADLSSSRQYNRQSDWWSGGYTLVELLIVLALTVLLLGLMWGITTSVELSQSRGRQLTEHAEFVRRVSSQFVADVAASIQDANSSSGRSLPAGDDDIRRFGLVGSATSLRLDVLRSFPLVVDRVAVQEKQLESMGADVAKTPKLPELKTVDYEFSQTKFSGLRRQEWDFHLSLRTGEPSETTIFSEATGAKFRYFDGASWHDSWDSIASESLPTAVELTLTTLKKIYHVVAYSPASPLQGHTEFARRKPPKEPVTTFPVFTPETFAPTSTTPPPQTTPAYDRTWMRGGR